MSGSISYDDAWRNICDHHIGRSRFRLMLRYIKFTHGYAQLDVYVLV